MSDEEVGKAVGLGRLAVNRRKNKPAFKAAIAESQLDALTIFRKNQANAARRLGELVNSNDLDVALRASIEHLKPLLRDEGSGAGQDGGELDRLLEDAERRRAERRRHAEAPAAAAAQ